MKKTAYTSDGWKWCSADFRHTPRLTSNSSFRIEFFLLRQVKAFIFLHIVSINFFLYHAICEKNKKTKTVFFLKIPLKSATNGDTCKWIYEF